MINYKSLGDEACGTFFETPNPSLEDIIKDIAIREELNPQEIERVCQRANTRVLLRLFKEGDDRTVEFDVADPRVIVRRINGSELERAGAPLFSIEDRDEVEGGESAPLHPPGIDYRELENLIFQLEDKIESLRTKLYEQRPTIIRDLASRIHHHGPRVVAIAFKKVAGPEELLKEAFDRAGIPYTGVDDNLDDYLVDDGDNLLQKVAVYGNMISNANRLSGHLEKLSFIRKAIRDPLSAMSVAGEVSSAGKKTKMHKDMILGKVQNQPRMSPPGQAGYLKPTT